MFYQTAQNDHGLPHNPFKAIVAPRPIGWISTLSKEGVSNLAPYSYFNAVSDNPEMVMFSSDGWKDSITNIKDTGEFVCNYPAFDLLDAMNVSSQTTDADVDEFELAQVETAKCELVSAPRVKAACASLECKLHDIIDLGAKGSGSDYQMVIGSVIGVHIDDAYLKDGKFDVEKANPYTRLGYADYAKIGHKFSLKRPKS